MQVSLNILAVTFMLLIIWLMCTIIEMGIKPHKNSLELRFIIIVILIIINITFFIK